MSAFKKLNYQDVFVTDYTARKNWHASGSVLDGYGVQTLRGLSTSEAQFYYPNDKYKNRYQHLVFKSADHLYFSGSQADATYSGSRDVSYQSTLHLSGSRQLSSEVGVISIPKDVYGVAIEPGTFILEPIFEAQDRYVSDGYAADQSLGQNQYVENIEYWYGSYPGESGSYVEDEGTYVDESTEEYIDPNLETRRWEIIDDGEGRLLISGSGLEHHGPVRVVGDIIYNQGQVLFTDPVVARYYSTFSRHKLRWKSNQPIYTYNVYCRVKDSEYNHTLNPTATTGSNGDLIPAVTGSEFTPYITTVGLYNDSNELIAVAKPNLPIPKSPNVETTFVIKLDL